MRITDSCNVKVYLNGGTEIRVLPFRETGSNFCSCTNKAMHRRAIKNIFLPKPFSAKRIFWNGETIQDRNKNKYLGALRNEVEKFFMSGRRADTNDKKIRPICYLASRRQPCVPKREQIPRRFRYFTTDAHRSRREFLQSRRGKKRIWSRPYVRLFRETPVHKWAYKEWISDSRRFIIVTEFAGRSPARSSRLLIHTTGSNPEVTNMNNQTGWLSDRIKPAAILQ